MGKLNLWKIFAVNLHLKLCLGPKHLWSHANVALQRYEAMQTLPRKITEPSYFAPQNHRAFMRCLAILWSKADFALQNYGEIVSGAKITAKNYLFSSFIYFFCKSMLFQRYVQPVGPLFKEKYFVSRYH